MPEIELHSKFVKAKDDVKTGDLITFRDAGKLDTEGQYGEKWIFTVALPNGKEKLLTINNTSLKTLKQEFGSNSDKWVGQQAMVHIVPKEVKGKFHNVIYLTHPNKDLDGQLIHQ